jgi:hypothetical protein
MRPSLSTLVKLQSKYKNEHFYLEILSFLAKNPTGWYFGWILKRKNVLSLIGFRQSHASGCVLSFQVLLQLNCLCPNEDSDCQLKVFWAEQTALGPRLPDGIFSNQKSQFGFILEGLALGDFGVFYGHLVYFAAIWYILWPFGIFFPFWYICCFKKNLATLPAPMH